jgi:hypothetical protein
MPVATRLLVTLLLLAPLPARAGGLLDAGGAKPVTVRFECPKEGETVTGPFTFLAFLNGGPPKPITVLVKCFGVTHHFHIPGRMSLLGQMPDQGLKDDLFPAIPGSHTLTLSVWTKDQPDALFETQVRFTLKEAESIEKELEDIRKELSRAWDRVPRARYGLWQAARKVKQGGPAEKRQEAAEALHRAQVEEFFRRIRVYTDLSELYEGNAEAERALKALNLAKTIFETEQEVVSAWPDGQRPPSLFLRDQVRDAPAHFAGFVRHFTRRNDLDEAVRWHQRIVSWYEKQQDRADLSDEKKKHCIWKAGEAYGDMGETFIRLRNDVAEYEACLEKAQKLQSQGTSPRAFPAGPASYRRTPR